MELVLHDVDLYDCPWPLISSRLVVGSGFIVAAGKNSRWPTAVSLLERLPAAVSGLSKPF